MQIIFLGFIFRLLVTVYIVLFESVGTLTYDSFRFHEEAIEFNSYLIEKENYSELTYTYKNYFSVLIGFLYNIFHYQNFLISNLLSSFVWFFSAVIFFKILKKINYDKKLINFLIFLYAFIFPTSIVYTSLLLTEVYILFLFNLLVLCIINFNLEKKYIIKNSIFLMFTILLIYLIHRANILFLILLFLSLSYLFFIQKFNLNKIQTFSTLVISIFFLQYFGLFEKFFLEIKEYLSGHFYETSYERANYFTIGDIKSLHYSFANFFILVLKNILNYLFQPLIYKVSSFKDLILVSENIFRAILIFIIFKKITLNFENKKIFVILSLIYFIMEFIYAQATVNWGTASRHHVPTLGTLILAAYFPIKKRIN